MSDNISCSASKICAICYQNISKYCCPRCNMLYCSVNCYKSDAHLECSENFYRECVNEEMGALDPDPSMKRKMMEILNKMRSEENDFDTQDPEKFLEMLNVDGADNHDDIFEEDVKDSDDDDSIPDLATRLEEVDLDDADKVWQMLTDDERKDFESLLNSGDVSKILPSWEPWWLYKKEKKLVVEVDESLSEKTKTDYETTCPNLYKSVKNFSAISKQAPAPCVKYNLINVLSSYLYTVRLFNGEHLSFCSEALSYIIAVSNNLRCGTNFDDSITALESVIQECHNNPSIVSDADTKSTMTHDLKCLLQGPEDSKKSFYLNCALSDLHALLHQAKMCCKGENDAKIKYGSTGEFTKRFADHQILNLPSISKDKIKMYIMKVEYYLSYLKDYGREIISCFNV